MAQVGMLLVDTGNLQRVQALSICSALRPPPGLTLASTSWKPIQIMTFKSWVWMKNRRKAKPLLLGECLEIPGRIRTIACH